MPKNSALSQQCIVDTFKKFKDDILDTDGKISPPSNGIWKKISEAFNHVLSVKYCYTLIKLNRHNLWKSLDLQCQGENDKISSDSNSDSKSDVSDTSECESFIQTDDEIRCKLHLNSEEWTRIEPVSKKYKSSERYKKFKKYTVLKPNVWPEMIHTKFWKICQLKCNIIFKRARIYHNSSIYCMIKGICNRCHSIFSGHNQSKPEANSDVDIVCKYRGPYKECTSEEKRHLKGATKSEALKKMCEKMLHPMNSEMH